MLLSKLLANATLVTFQEGMPVRHEITADGVRLTTDHGEAWSKLFRDSHVEIVDGKLVLGTTDGTTDCFLFVGSYSFRVLIPFSKAALHAQDLRDTLDEAHANMELNGMNEIYDRTKALLEKTA